MISYHFNRLICRIDELNRQDPHQTTVDGTPWPSEFVYSQRLTAWVKRLNPRASEALLIAARGQHIQRWSIPRTHYPDDRAGYLRWREDLKKHHAALVTRLMQEEGYPPETIATVETIIRKRNLKDPDTQTIEDALCLMFLQYQFDDLMTKTPEGTMVGILQKTWRKMSAQGQAAAKQMTYSPQARALLDKALANP
jgi:hypothetical protein